MAITQNVYIGNGTSLIYSFSWPYLNREDVRVQIDDVSQTLVTDYSFESEQTIRFVNAPADQSRIVIFRVTNTDDLEHVFYPGSAIRAKDLNTDFTQSLFVSQESQNVSYDASEIGYLYPPELGGEYSNVQDALTEALTTGGGGGGGDSSVTSVNGKIGIVELGLVDLDDVSVGFKTGPPTQLCYEGASTFTISVLSNGVSTGTITPELLKITDITYDSSESCPTGGGRDFYIVNWLSTLGDPGSTKLQFGGPCGSVVYTWAQNFTGDSTCFTPGPSPSIEDGDVLVYDSTSLKWVAKPNSDIIGGDGINTSTDLSGDVTVEVDIADIDPGLEFNNGELTAKAATAFSLGSVKAGYGLSVDFDGTLNSTFDPSQLDGEFLSLSPFAGAQTVLSNDTTEFLGKVSSESTTELDPGNTLITKDYLESVNSSVTTSDTPPLNPELGDLWWDSSADSGRLYVYYSDGLAGQWVEASPAGSGGSGDYLPITGGELTGDLEVDGSITAAGNILSTGTTNNDIRFQSKTFAAETFSVIGDGTLKIQEDKIVLNGSDGSIIAAGGFIELRSAGTIRSKAASSGETHFIDVGTQSDTVYIQSTSSGSATPKPLKFYVKESGTTTTHTFATDGSVEFGGSITAAGDISSPKIIARSSTSTNKIWSGGISAGAENSFIRADGSADFAGGVTAAAADNAYSFNISRADEDLGGFFSNSSGAYCYLKPTGGGNAKIELNGGDGSAQFAGDVSVGGQLLAAQSLKDQGNAFRVSETTGNVFIGSQNTLATAKTSLMADGSATFAGNIQSGDDPNGGSEQGAKSYLNGGFYTTSNGTTRSAFKSYVQGDSTPTVQILHGGDATFTGTVTATVVPPSDARFKENITPAKPQLADVVALGGLLKNYDWNDQAPLNEEIRSVRQLGLIAQEAAEVCPSIVKDIHHTKTVEVKPAVTGPKGRVITEAVTEEVDDSYKGISTDALIMKLIGAVAELSAEVQSLKGASN